MDTITQEHELAQSQNIVTDNLAKLKQLFPTVFTEGKVDFDALRSVLGDYVENENERYQFTWKGKAQALREAHKTSTGTLRPCPEESVNWDSTQNLYIEGDNLEVLKLLQKSYHGSVKMIYIDPPYNTGQDFVYKDDYKDNLKNYLNITKQGRDYGTNSENSGRFHSNWLNMFYPRLKLARNLLCEEGLIFVSIDDKEISNARKILDEVFGEENFVECLIWKKRYGGGAKEKYLVSLHEYTLIYCKNIESLDEIFIPLSQESIDKYYKLKDGNLKIRGPYRTHPLEATKSMGERKNLVYGIPGPDGEMIFPQRQWLWSQERALKALADGELEFVKSKGGGLTVHSKQYLKDENGELRMGKAFSIVDDVFTQHGTNEIIDLFGNAQIFSFPKPTNLIKKFIQIGNVKSDELVLDFFSGSSTTAHAILEQNATDGINRRFIMVQLPEIVDENSEAYKAGYRNIAEIGQERIRRVIKKIQNENSDKAKETELGFKVLRLDSSNIKEWDPATTDLQISLYDSINNIKGERTETDILYEILLKYGLDLTLPIVEYQIAGNNVYSIGHSALLVCLSEKITMETIGGIGELKEDLAPEVCRVVLRDNGFQDDVAKTNAMQVLKRYGIEDVKSI